MEPWQLETTIRQTQLILENYHRWFGEDLIDGDRPLLEQSRTLFESPFVVFSHGTEADPIYNYGSRLGLELWERTWDELVKMPSRESAAAQEQKERYDALADSRNYGYKSDFSAVRVTKSGRPVRIEDVKLYDLLDESGKYRGQAAVFSKWTFLD